MPRLEVYGDCFGAVIVEAAPAARVTRPQQREEKFDMPNRDADGGVPIRVDALEKSFGPREVLKGINLAITPGEFVTIVGQSGCGKSTLLRLLAGLEAPTAGTVALDGEAPRSGSPLVRMMFQDARLLPWRRVQANVSLGLPAERRGDALAALEEVGLADRGGDWPAVLSGGQRQRVALARALASRPRLLLLDEPLGALDALTRLEMQSLIERVWEEHGFTAVLVTHDVDEAVALADRIIVLDAGQIALALPVDLPRPRDHATHRFTEIKATVLDQVLGVHRERPAKVRDLALPAVGAFVRTA
jgi:sulfonate transport system ATP-binding protein